jgi:GntR family transcriptional regulator / MocR family aminotransferase
LRINCQTSRVLIHVAAFDLRMIFYRLLGRRYTAEVELSVWSAFSLLVKSSSRLGQRLRPHPVSCSVLALSPWQHLWLQPVQNRTPDFALHHIVMGTGRRKEPRHVDRKQQTDRVRLARKRPRSSAVPMIAVDRHSETPLYRQIYDALRAMILDRILASGQQLPSTRAFAHELRISRIPVLDAYAQLLAEGYIESRSGAGTFVKISLTDQFAGLRPTTPSPSKDVGNTEISQLAQLLPVERTPWFPSSGAFSVGQIAYDHFPFRIWSDLVTSHARRVRAGSLNYADPMGSGEFREAIAAYLRTARAVRCEASQIMIVNGSQHALDLSARVLLDPNTPVWIEEPGYELLRYTLLLSGCRLVPVPVDGEGLDVAAGMKLCPTARAAFVTPSHQYPLGATMSPARRLQLLEWAHSHRAWIVEDDYDSEYRYESMPVASLQGLDPGSRVIYIGTFSKTLFPSLRLGYIVIPQALIARFQAVRRANDLFPSPLYQAALADFLEAGHFTRHVRKTRQLYAERCKALTQALKAEFGTQIEILGSEAGMHLVVTFRMGCSDRAVAAHAAREGLWLWPLSAAYAGERVRHGFILGFGGTKAEDMVYQVGRLRKATRESGHSERAKNGN